MATLSLRRAGPDDAALVREISREAYARWVPVVNREPWPMTADYDHAVRHHRVDLLLRDDVVAGLIELIPAADHLLIENVAVRPAFQGLGLGRHLMVQAEAVAAALGVCEIRLYTNQLFASNVALYLKLGYAITRMEEVSGAGTVVHMTKAVPAP